MMASIIPPGILASRRLVCLGGGGSNNGAPTSGDIDVDADSANNKTLSFALPFAGIVIGGDLVLSKFRGSGCVVGNDTLEVRMTVGADSTAAQVLGTDTSNTVHKRFKHTKPFKVYDEGTVVSLDILSADATSIIRCPSFSVFVIPAFA